MRRYALFFFLIMIYPWSYASATYATCEGTTQNPCLVQDTQNNTPRLKQWRTAKMLSQAAKDQGINATGLENLWVSGSAEPSAQGFQTVVKNIQSTAPHQIKTIVDVDVRQESHGFLNNNAITLAAANDWINLGKSRRQVFNDEKKWLLRLGRLNVVKNVLTPQQFKAREFHTGKTVSIQGVKNEKEIAENTNLTYYRLTVPDHMAPSDEDVDRFVELVRKTPPTNWIHIHCRAGDGRTTMFMVMYDMLRNADKVSLDDIVKREAAIAPSYNILTVQTKDPIKVPLFQQRALFIRKFYIFAQAYLNGYIGKWSTWSDKHKEEPRPQPLATPAHS